MNNLSMGNNSGAFATGLTNAYSTDSNTIYKDRGVVSDDYLYTLSLLEPSLKHLPEPADTDRPKQYVPRNPYRTPAYFPAVPPSLFDSGEFFEKLSVDTLFFIFYFQQGTPHQYLAARELKKKSWRYHKNFLTWFQRHDDPKLATDEYEQGTYLYFDYESGWCQRIKSDFTFEYRHLEDELAVPLSASL
jgi:CCR4-NOT transcription complex subunit 3